MTSTEHRRHRQNKATNWMVFNARQIFACIDTPKSLHHQTHTRRISPIKPTLTIRRIYHLHPAHTFNITLTTPYAIHAIHAIRTIHAIRHQKHIKMSFLTESAVRRVALASRLASTQAPRQFSTSMAARKTIAETAKDTLKTVDRKVSDKLVDGINVGSKLPRSP